MRCFLEVVNTPSCDAQGTILSLHFDQKRYLLGQISEGSQRALIERGISMKKVSEIFVTGRTQWSNIGGLLGAILVAADVSQNIATSRDRPVAGDNPSASSVIGIHGPPNLRHMIAASRRFIFRKGMPMDILEYSASKDSAANSTPREPDWQDEHVKVWALPLLPEGSPKPPIFERSANDEAQSAEEKRKFIVNEMFNSSWKIDQLIPQRLHEVEMPAAVFVEDPEGNGLKLYEGPLPGTGEAIPDIRVWVRKPWPGALVSHLPPTTPAYESVSYIICNHTIRGKFRPEKAKEHKVAPGEKFGKLAEGQSVLNEDGETVTPDMVLDPPRPGNAFAIVDIPTTDYISSLIDRSEWKFPAVTESLTAIVWILGPGVAADHRLKTFQEAHPTVKHLVSSVDCCDDTVVVRRAALDAIRNGYINPSVETKLQYPRPVLELARKQPDSEMMLPEVAEAAQPKQVLDIEPALRLRNVDVKPPTTVEKLSDEARQQVNEGEMADVTFTPEIIEKARDWATSIPCADAEVLVLGTGSSHPGTSRNVSGTLVRVPGCGSYLLDCGEGTLGTLRRMFSPRELVDVLLDLKVIWISHLHADHHLGTTSVLKAWYTASEEHAPRNRLSVISDAAMSQWLYEYSTAEDFGLSRIDCFSSVPVKSRSSWETPIPDATLRRVVSAYEVDEINQNDEQTLHPLGLQAFDATCVSHCRGAQAVSFTFKTGLKVSYSGDCRPSSAFAEIGRGSHLLIHEATFEDDLRGDAIAKKHSTAGEALIVAAEMQAKVCLLTHFSQRYPKMPQLGVKLNGSRPATADLKNALEESEEEQPDASAPDTNESKQEPEEGATHPLSSDDGPQPSVPQNTPKQLGQPQDRRPITETDIQRLISEHDIRVLFAFDFMRFKIQDAPLVESRQPLMCEVYERIAAARDAEVDEDNLTEEQKQKQAEIKRRALKTAEKQKRLAESKAKRKAEWATEKATRDTSRERVRQKGQRTSEDGSTERRTE